VTVVVVQVTMKEDVENWLESLLKVTQETISDKVYEIDRDIKNGSTVEEYTTIVRFIIIPCPFFCSRQSMTILFPLFQLLRMATITHTYPAVSLPSCHPGILPAMDT